MKSEAEGVRSFIDDPACMILEFLITRQVRLPGVHEHIVIGKFQYSFPALNAAEALNLVDQIRIFLLDLRSAQEKKIP